MRGKGKDLLPEHMEVLCDICTNKVRIIVSVSMKKGDLVQGMQTLKRVATKDNFYAYFEVYRRRKVLSDERGEPYHLPTTSKQLRSQFSDLTTIIVGNSAAAPDSNPCGHVRPYCESTSTSCNY